LENLTNIHPGEVLDEEFMKPFNLTNYKLAKAIDVQQITISLIKRGKRGITADKALRFSKYFGTTPEFWMNLQREYDLRNEKARKKDVLDNILPYVMES
jgi:addiction module HigA family antidote